MQLEKQVVSLELAKKLKELGVRQESMFYWYWGTEPSTLWYHAFLEEQHNFDESQIYSAFTVAELGEMLPWLIEKSDKKLWLSLGKNGPKHPEGVWTAFYEEPQVKDEDIEIIPWPEIISDTEANARAKMLIYLIENKLVDLPK